MRKVYGNILIGLNPVTILRSGHLSKLNFARPYRLSAMSSFIKVVAEVNGEHSELKRSVLSGILSLTNPLV
jgi:hypothetical protein